MSSSATSRRMEPVPGPQQAAPATSTLPGAMNGQVTPSSSTSGLFRTPVPYSYNYQAYHWMAPISAVPLSYCPDPSSYLPLYQQDWFTILHRLKQQIEFYFSLENLLRDDYLVQQMMENQGSVPCHVVGSFPRVLGIVGGYPASPHLLARALSTSSIVRVYGHYLCPLTNALSLVLQSRASKPHQRSVPALPKPDVSPANSMQSSNTSSVKSSVTQTAGTTDSSKTSNASVAEQNVVHNTSTADKPHSATPEQRPRSSEPNSINPHDENLKSSNDKKERSETNEHGATPVTHQKDPSLTENEADEKSESSSDASTASSSESPGGTPEQERVARSQEHVDPLDLSSAQQNPAIGSSIHRPYLNARRPINRRNFRDHYDDYRERQNNVYKNRPYTRNRRFARNGKKKPHFSTGSFPASADNTNNNGHSDVLKDMQSLKIEGELK